MSEVDGNALLPCPFCGGKAKLVDGGDAFYVICKTARCSVEGRGRVTKRQAIAAWNRRAPDTPSHTQVEERG